MLILASLIVLGIIIFTNILSFANIENVIINQLMENQRLETEFAANSIENHIKQVKDELVTLSKFPLMESLDLNNCTGDMRIIHENIESKIDSLLRVDKYGNVVECSSPRFSNFLGLNIKNKDYFKTPKETNEPFIAGLVRQGASHQIIISTPLFETTRYTPYPNFIGDFNGVLMTIIELDHLYNLYLHPFLGSERSFFFLINADTEETLLKSEGVSDYHDIKSGIPETKNGLSTIFDFDGFGDTIITSSDLILGPETWRLIVLTPLKNIGSEISAVQKRHFFSLAFIIIVVFSGFLLLISLYKSREEVQAKLDRTNVTLEKLGIKIEFEKDKFTRADVSLDPGKVYLVKEDDENHAHELFISSLNKGYAGLGIVREDPRKIRKKYNLQKTSFIWLTNIKVDKIPCETNIDNIFNLVSEFVKKSKKSVILIDRLDYILTENTFDNVIKKIHALKDLSLSYETIIILSVKAELFDEKQLKAIEAETVDLYGKHFRKNVELSDLELGILKYVNENNASNKLVSYKDITSKFGITKPTTRSKIRKLQRLQLLDVEQKGRFKSIKITSAGRRII
ncbi:MAG: DUF835 domain-containing protein [Bdellovibrio sp.]|nr:MAG: DUF835 domain-containing protein [Bdellovibrio sp.]